MITEKKHPVLDMNYISGQKNIIFENGILCTPLEFADTCKMSRAEIEALMQEWSEDPKHFKYDYAYAKSTGVLRHYQKKPVQQNIKADFAENLQKQEERPSKTGVSPAKERLLTPAFIIMFIMCVTGILSAVMSDYHTTVANTIFGRPVAVGLVTGTVMVLFSATAFTAARWFWAEKGFAKVFSVLFAALGIMVIAYSMMSTLIVNYDAWNKTATEEKIETASNSEELASYDSRVELKEGELKELKETEAKLTEEAEFWKDKSWKRYDSLQEQISTVREKASVARAELSSLIEQRPQVASKAAEEKEDAFTFLSTFIKISPRTLRLFMQAVPAMFFDIIAPFALSCALYLAERKKEEKNG